jgi:urease accessory protein
VARRVNAHATVVAERDGRCSTLRSDPPVTLRPTPEGLHIVGSAAGPVGGDDIAFDVALKAGAALEVRSVAAQLVYPGARGEPSHASTRVTLAAGAALRWLPEPLVVVRGADHRVVTEIAITGDASLVWREIAVLGRHDEAAGSVRQRLRVTRDGAPLLTTDVQLGPAWPHAAGPAGTNGARVVATILLVGHAPPSLAVSPALRVGVCQLAADAYLITALADSVTPILEAMTRLIGGALPPE